MHVCLPECTNHLKCFVLTGNIFEYERNTFSYLRVWSKSFGISLSLDYSKWYSAIKTFAHGFFVNWRNGEVTISTLQGSVFPPTKVKYPYWPAHAISLNPSRGTLSSEEFSRLLHTSAITLHTLYLIYSHTTWLFKTKSLSFGFIFITWGWERGREGGAWMVASATGWHVKDTKTMESYMKTSRPNSHHTSRCASCPDNKYT